MQFILFLDGIDDDFEASHNLFRDAFKSGFPWECLKVLSGPPGPVIFTWRHWAHFNGKFQGRQGSGELIEMYGLCRVIVNVDLKIQKLEVSFEIFMKLIIRLQYLKIIMIALNFWLKVIRQLFPGIFEQ